MKRIFRQEQWLFIFNIVLSKIINRNKNPNDFYFNSILVIKLDEIGDMAAATHVFSMLKKAHPNSKITVLCKSFCVDLVKNHPDVDYFITDIKQLDSKFDLVVHLRGTFKTFWKVLFGMPKFHLDRGTVRFRNRKIGQLHETKTNYEIIKPVLKGLDFERPKIYTSLINDETASNFLVKNKIGRFALLHTGARRVLRQWSGKNFSLIAKYLKENHDLNIVFSGGNEDVQNIEQIREIIPFETYSFIGSYNLLDFASLAKKAEIFIGNESGPLQIVNCQDTSLVGLFGPGVKDVFYPLGDNAISLHHILDCNPCNQIDCVQPSNPCINLISVYELENAVKKLLNF